MPGRTEFNLGFGALSPTARPRAQGVPQRLLLLGDFSALPAAERVPLVERRTHRVDLDTLDATIARMQPRLNPGGGSSLAFASLDDFHPDALLQRWAPLAELRAVHAAGPGAASGGGALLAGLLGQTTPAVAAVTPAAPPAAGIDAFIHGIVAPHIRPDTRQQDDSHCAAVDAVTAERLRALLHDPAFQSLEANWRGVHWLLSRLELGEHLQLHLFDVRPDEIAADIVAAGGDVARSGLHAALTGRHHGERHWAALVSLLDMTQGQGHGQRHDTSFGLLAALATLAGHAGAPALVAAQPQWLGWNSFADANARDAAPLPGWQQLRSSAVAPWIAAAAPRLLLRLPYGKRLDAIDSFAFEEINGAPQPEQLLWAPAPLALALLLGQSVHDDGELGDPQDHAVVADLPAYSFADGGEPALQPCAEQHLGSAALQRLAGCGVVALASHRHAASVQVQRLQSLALPATALAGVWTGG